MSSLKSKLRSGKAIYGSWLTLAHPGISEIMASAGFDFLVVDMEHSAIDLSQAQMLVQSIQAQGVAALIRVGDQDPNRIKRAMDTGVDGVIVPMIKNRAEAEAAVAAVHYPPHGTRGVGLARAQKYGFGFEGYKRWLWKEGVVIGIIEHHEAIENLEDILGVDGLDGTMIGPYDLSGSLGFPGEFDRPVVRKLIDRYESVCRRMKKPMGFHVVHPDTKRVLDYQKRGYKFLAVGLDSLYLGLKSRETMKQIRRGR
jgi:2-dehydro-3-deoxyglucarate aldolase